MSNDVALLDCTFGWGKTCRLYEDSIEIAGKVYKLDDLTSIHPIYRNILGIPSARLELSFGQERLVLRGISDLETARRLVSHLLARCSTQAVPERPRSRSAKSRDLVRAQAKAWERTNKLPTPSCAPQETQLDPGSKDVSTLSSRPLIHAQSLPPAQPPCIEIDETARPTQSLLALSKTLDVSEQPTNLLMPCEYSDALFPTESQPVHLPCLQPPLRPIHLVNSAQKKLDSSPIPAVFAPKASVLPVLHVPIRLQLGEYAHYSVGATLYSDRILDAEQALYQPLDPGLLILTNRRILYLGKLSQLILPYTHFWYVSLIQNAIVLHIKQQFRRIIIEVEHAQEWANRINQLAFLARCTPIKPAPIPLATSTQLALKPPSGLDITLKRPVIKAPTALSALEPSSDPEATLKRPAIKAPATNKEK